MKAFKILSLFLLISCSGTDDKKSLFPPFKANAKIDDLHGYVRKVAEENDFSIILSIPTEDDNGWYKIFASKFGRWYKVDIRESVFDIEELKRNPDYCSSRDVIIYKPCTSNEAGSFLSKLKSYGLFELPEESELRVECEGSGRTDMVTTYIDIVSGNEMRSLNYSEVYRSNKHCPDVKEWKNIIMIEDLFEDEWIPDSLIHY